MHSFFLSFLLQEMDAHGHYCWLTGKPMQASTHAPFRTSQERQEELLDMRFSRHAERGTTTKALHEHKRVGGTYRERVLMLHRMKQAKKECNIMDERDMETLKATAPGRAYLEHRRQVAKDQRLRMKAVVRAGFDQQNPYNYALREEVEAELPRHLSNNRTLPNSPKRGKYFQADSHASSRHPVRIPCSRSQPVMPSRSHVNFNV